MIIIYILALFACFVLLSRIVYLFFIDSLDKISNDLKLSSDVAGATLMAIGSSAPELFVALFAVFKPGEHETIGIGSIVGSAIFNLLVIVGASAMVRKAKLTWQPVVRDLIFYTVSVTLLVIFIWDGSFSIFESVALLIVYILYVVAAIFWRKILPYEDPISDIIEEKKEDKKGNLKYIDQILRKLFPNENNYYLIFFQSIIFIAALSWALVELAVATSAFLNIPEAIVALTVLAVGTSIPDLFSSMIVAKQGRSDMAVSNAVGSNIFDILVGLGFPFLIYMLIHGSSVGSGKNDLMYSVIILFASVVILFLMLVFSKWRVGRLSGIFLLFLYFIYVTREIIILYI